MNTETLSIIIPVYNEAKALPLLHAALEQVHEQFPGTEVIFIDDGSKDDSRKILRELAAKDPRVKVVLLATNFGQTAALSAGIERATGDIIIPMDSDLENDPADIKHLVAKMHEGHDVVSGWRKDRWGDAAITRKLPSMAANALISYVAGLNLHDYGCTLKAYRRDIIQGVPLYGEMHRFIPAYASWQGARVTEMPVSFKPRPFGVSNYGFSRTLRVLLDLFVLRFLDRYMDRPMHLFGGLGFILFFLGIISGTLAVGLRIFTGLHLVETPLPLLSALFLIMGLMLIMLGIISEMQMRTYYESKNSRPYRVGEEIGFK